MKSIYILGAVALLFTACKKKGCTDETALNYSAEAEKDDGSCEFATWEVPTTFSFTDANGNNTVAYSGQTERLNQLEEMTIYMKSGNAGVISADIMKDMFANTGGDGAGNFSFSSTKQMKDKCWETDAATFEGWMEDLAVASISHAETAAPGQAGTLTTGSSTYIFDDNGVEHVQLIEKGLMGAVFLHQALNIYFGSGKMDLDNNTPVDPDNGKYYTVMEHHWDEAFGYFGAPIDFPTNKDGIRFWAKYSDRQDAALGCNSIIMDAFIKGRYAISEMNDLNERDAQIEIIRKEWERFCASQAITYLEGAKDNFGTDNGKYLHELSEAYSFIMCLKYIPLDTRVINYTQIENLLDNTIGLDFWAVTLVDLNSAINELNTIYGF
ncbi:MAG: DUF4856 domain-containing protein [Crocinitomicaceae bacterium]